MKKETTKKEKSDVGLDVQLSLKDQIVQFKQLNDNIELKRKYDMTTSSIKNYLHNVMGNYLNIGVCLNEVEKNKLYLANEYKSTIEYAQNEFQLSTTTIRNSMAISNKFCDEHGNLLQAYKDFSYSHLVELLSVDELELSNYSPSMTVKAIRSQKLVGYIDKALSGLFESGLVKTYIDFILNYDFNEKLKTKDFKVDYQVDKQESLYSNYHGLNFEINFTLFNKTSNQKIKFDLKYYRDEFKIYSGNPWYHEKFTSASLEKVLDSYCSKLLKDDLIQPETQVKKSKQATKKFSQAKEMPNYYNDSIIKSIQNVTGDEPVYYNHKNNDTREIYVKPEISKKNPPFIIVERSQDPFNIKVKYLSEMKDKEPIYLEDDAFQVAVEIFKAQFESILANRLKEHDTGAKPVDA